MSKLHLNERYRSMGRESGPFSFLNPTTRRLPFPQEKSKRSRQAHSSSQDEESSQQGETMTQEAIGDEVPATGVERNWRSRDNRKGRHAIVVTHDPTKEAQFLTPPPTNTLKQTIKGIGRMFTVYAWWDVSWLVAFIFTWGSVVWVINAFFVWLPLVDPSTEFKGESFNGGGITAFIGATIFEIGSVLLMIEAVNESREDCFGWAVEQALEDSGLVHLRPGECRHHHDNHGNLVGKGNASEDSNGKDGSARAWTWFPSWHELKTYYFKEVGFIACLAQLFGATVFWISGFTALPPIYDRLTSTAAQNGAYWLPQVIGGTGFIVSGVLFMLETQKKWYLPAFNVLGWHIGAWNLLGGIGFTLCGVLGFDATNTKAVYQGCLATFWGSWCFLVGSVIQWYESLDKHPVDVEKKAENSLQLPQPK